MTATILRRATGLGLTGLLVAAAVGAQDPVHTHIFHVADTYSDTPNLQGLLPTARAEAEVALVHARLAAAERASVATIRRHAGHVLHALDPSIFANGPGLGYGVKRGVTEAARHIDLATAADSVSENVSVHGLRIGTALAGVVQRTDEATRLAEDLQLAASLTEAISLAALLAETCEAIVYGRDADGDGRVGWREEEGGLRQATYHINLMKRGEGLAP